MYFCYSFRNVGDALWVNDKYGFYCEFSSTERIATIRLTTVVLAELLPMSRFL